MGYLNPIYLIIDFQPTTVTRSANSEVFRLDGDTYLCARAPYNMDAEWLICNATTILRFADGG